MPKTVADGPVVEAREKLGDTQERSDDKMRLKCCFETECGRGGWRCECSVKPRLYGSHLPWRRVGQEQQRA